ncbi:MAG: hypothetical protein AAFN59_09280 [Pseudomonadota bacterium]
MSEILMEIARNRRLAALDAVANRRDNVFDIRDTSKRLRPLLITSRAA